MKTIGVSGGSRALLGGVGAVVQADAEDRPRHVRGEQRDVGERVRGAAPRASRSPLRRRAGDGRPVVEGDDLIAADLARERLGRRRAAGR